MAKPRAIDVTETAREERIRCRALVEAGYMPVAEYVARFNKRPDDEESA